MTEVGRRPDPQQKSPGGSLHRRSESARVIAVIGMHRSGTSLVVRALQALGAGLGSNLSTRPSPDNAKGHWEDQDVVRLNGELLDTLALRWDLIGADDGALMEATALQPLVERARILVRARVAESSVWAFKDPRTARLWPFWRRVLLEDDELRPGFVWVVRRPWAVAQSLARRNGFSSLQSHLLWLNHNLAPFADVAANPHVVIDYDRLLERPMPELERMAGALALQPPPGRVVEEFIGGFLDPDLRHFGTAGEAPPGAGAESTANRAYRALLEVAAGASSLGAPEFLAEWREVGREAAAFSDIALRVDSTTLVERTASGLAETQRQQSEDVERRLLEVQAQLSATQRQQSEDMGRRLLEVQESLQAQFEEVRSRAQRTETSMTALIELLDEERYTVLKPLLRRAYRFAVAAAMRLPAPMIRRLQHWKRRFLPRLLAPALEVGRSAAVGPGLAVDLGEPSPGRHDILVCPVIDWHFRLQRPQQLARQLAGRGHRIFYLSTTFDTADVPGFEVLESPGPNIFLIRLCFPGKPPLIYQDPARDQTVEHLVAAVGELIFAGSLSRLIVLANLPFWRPLAEALPGCPVVYDCMDHHAGFSSNGPDMLQEEERLLRRADLVVTTSARLSETVGRVAENLLIRNAGDVEYFSRAPKRLAYESGRPVAGYLGAVAEWFDVDLVAAAARRFADWDFVLVGSTDTCDTARIEELGNVKLIGEVPYESAAGWLHSFDVALIPFKLTELTLCTNPVKAYEYLAAGKPVVATALPEMKLMAEVVHVAENHAHFIELLGTAMAEREVPELAVRRTGWARGHDWKVRAEQLEDAVRGMFPRVSVIVLTYNNLAFTQACLRSLEANTHCLDWELILVDNASTDGTREFLADYVSHNPRARLVQNEENLGFAAGNNQGLTVAEGEYLVILNNDTYATPGWLVGLVRHLRNDPSLGLVGPVTNNIGNEAKIDIHYTDMSEMQKAAWAYTSRHAGEELEIPTVAFFCVAIPRTAYAKVGGLDERFGLGFFEDDDYCRRIRQAGFRIAVAEDVFVHHHLSASFDLIDEGRRQALFERNRALYEEKWGPWAPHEYRS